MTGVFALALCGVTTAHAHGGLHKGPHSEPVAKCDAKGKCGRGMDPTFGQEGLEFDPIEGLSAKLTASVRLKSGKVLVGGTIDPPFPDEILLVRYHDDGDYDEGFGDKSMARVKGLGMQLFAITEAPDGKLLLVGKTNVKADKDRASKDRADPRGLITLARLTASGKLDTTFGDKGLRRLDLSGHVDEPTGATLQPDGRLLVMGTTRLTGSFMNKFAVVRLILE